MFSTYFSRAAYEAHVLPSLYESSAQYPYLPVAIYAWNWLTYPNKESTGALIR